MRNALGLRALLLCGTMACAGSDAFAQTNAELLQELRALRARVDEQSAEIESLRAQVDAQSEVLGKANQDIGKQAELKPAFKAAPEFKDGDWKFKIRGRFMYDVGYTENPNNQIGTKALGFNSRIRRARLGVEGTMPGDFAYKAEADFHSNLVEWADLFLEWSPVKDVTLRVGHYDSFQSMEQPTSSRFITFLERAQFTDGYNQTRRLGGSVAYANDKLYLAGGLFNEGIGISYDNDGWLLAGRGVFMPKLDDTQLHLGASFQHRGYNSSSLGARYRSRPNPRLTDVRFVDTGTIAADKDTQLGLEAFAIHGPLHIGGEASWLWVNAIGPADIGPADNIPVGAIIANGNPSFFSYYLEAGYFFTGESRGYKKSTAQWDRTKVLNPLNKGGPGAISANVRWDSLNLNDPAIQSGGINTSSSHGGRSNALSLNLIWQPIDYVRITTQYTRMDVKGGPYALKVNGETSGDATDYGYKVNVIGTRFAFDF
ncbi:hypothetical protein L6Q21_08685 [Sandaracinobacter sp. RS1-74]|uniref:OprO/OprP family phosphate-selective porin n=1 Tax=Sandaracinobacteroides sayramensis TaxID=2913411 RepID=UPI001EDC9103|nr:porin [Sandaracinobacteroides sayramensis]MCG2841057.1 hypothetical protein [Sandaracinobacteroides sayramensis]